MPQPSGQTPQIDGYSSQVLWLLASVVQPEDQKLDEVVEASALTWALVLEAKARYEEA